MALAGDGRQIPPIVPGGGKSETCAPSTMSSSNFSEEVQVRYLTETMRNTEDPSLAAMVDGIGNGVALADSDGLVDIPGVRGEITLQSSLEFAPPKKKLGRSRFLF